MALNNAVTALGEARRLPEVDLLVAHMQQAGRSNSFTWAAAFRAYGAAGRQDKAVAAFQRMCQQVGMRGGRRPRCSLAEHVLSGGR